MKQFSLKARNVSKVIDGPLIEHINFTALSGEIHAIIGNNGEGKTIFAQVLAGIRPKTSGEIYIDDVLVNYNDISHAQKLGIYMIQQEIHVFPKLTVWENLIYGNEAVVWDRHLFTPSKKKMIDHCRKVLEEYQIDLDLYARVSTLGESQKRMIQLVHTLISRPKILILDEFSTFLSSKESEHIFSVLEQLKKKNVMIILITHRYPEIPKHCDQVSVINDGTITGNFRMDEFEDKNFRYQIATLNMDFRYPKIDLAPGEELLHVQTPPHSKMSDVDIHLYRNSILGITGLTNAQKKELYLYITAKSPNIGLIPETSAKNTIFANQSLPFNITISNAKKLRKGGLVSNWKSEAYAKSYLDKLGFHNVDIYTKPNHLSSGNQQKLLISRSLFNDSEIYFYDDPARTLDATSRLELYNILNALALKGASIVLLSSNYSELIGLCGRVVLFKDGKQIGNYATDYLSSDVLYEQL